MTKVPAEGQYLLVFDGGSKGNPGLGYGSFCLIDGDGRRQVGRCQFGNNVTNNQAEYRALIAGLKAASSLARRQHSSPTAIHIEVQGDSQLVLNQLAGKWRVRNPRLAQLHSEAAKLLSQFGARKLTRVPRAKIVKVLGH